MLTCAKGVGCLMGQHLGLAVFKRFENGLKRRLERGYLG